MKQNVTFLNKVKKVYSPCLVSVVHIGAFNCPPHFVTVLSTEAQLEININDRSSMRAATYQMDAQ